MKKHYYNTPVRDKKVAQRKIRAQRKIPVQRIIPVVESIFKNKELPLYHEIR